MKFKFLEHTADIKFQAFGSSIEKVFKNSALAMFSAMSKEEVKKTKNFRFEVEGKDYESLLYNFLEELLYLFDSEHFFLSGFKSLKIKGMKLEAEIFGDDAKNYDIGIDVKAVTYNEMFVKEENRKWISQVVLDV